MRSIKKISSLILVIDIFFNTLAHSLPTREESQDVEHKAPIRWVSLAANDCLAVSGRIINQWALSQMGSTEMAVSELINSSQMFATILSVGFIEGVEDLIAREKRTNASVLPQTQGKLQSRHLDQISSIYTHALGITFLMSIPAGFSPLIIKPFMLSYGYSSDLYSGFEDYYNIFPVVLPIRSICFLNMNFLIGMDKAFYASLIGSSSILAAGLNVLMLHGPDSVRCTNPFQAQAATMLIESSLCCLGFAAVCKFDKDMSKHSFFTSKFSKKTLRQIWRLGLPLFTRGVILLSAPLVFTQFVIPNQKNALALLFLSAQIFLVPKLITNAIGRAANLCMKKTRGVENSFMIAKHSFKKAALTSVFFAVTFSLLYSKILPFFINNQNPEYQNFSDEFDVSYKIISIEFAVSSIKNASTWILRGVGDYKSPVISDSVAFYCITLPLSSLSLHYGFGINGLFWSSTLGHLASLGWIQYKIGRGSGTYIVIEMGLSAVDTVYNYIKRAVSGTYNMLCRWF